eukprot:gnl/MRDRNA2_/MRDRNA2_160267_c0_seq1.p1 gnl/MRDRNA2_/MRDRNA2_160267_c0~~gnl/MRDRNA2_/MRDRNA2_160267_c0_seq1.p1  ORF type:complete len:856 (-),score=160.83 gnl/MRDRNA2_/MRDRNA2_160267_c0_seq1:109-2601(-)
MPTANGEQLGHFMKRFNEYCIDFNFPIVPGVKASVGVSGSFESMGINTKTMTVEIAGGIILRLPPVSLMLRLEGALSIETQEAMKFSALVSAALMRIVNEELHKVKSHHDLQEELLHHMNSQLADFDEGFTVGFDRQRAQWRIAMAERIIMLQTSVGIQLSEAMRKQSGVLSGMIDMVEKTQATKFAGRVTAAHLQGVVKVLNHIAKLCELQEFQVPSGTKGQIQTYQTLLRYLNRFITFEISRLAELIAEKVAHTMFDPKWKPEQYENPKAPHRVEGTKEFHCYDLSNTEMVWLASCDGQRAGPADYSCYPKLHDGKPLADGDTTTHLGKPPTKFQVVKKQKAKVMGANVEYLLGLSKARMLCSLLDGWPEVQASSLGGDNVDNLDEFKWELPGGKWIKIPYAILKVRPILFLELREYLAMDRHHDIAGIEHLNKEKDIPALQRKIKAYLDKLSDILDFTTLLSHRDVAVNKMADQDLVEADWHLRAGVCGQAGKEAGCAKQIRGWLLEVETAKQEKEKLKTALGVIIDKKEHLNVLDESVSFTWNFDGSLQFGVDLSAKGPSICNDNSVFQIASHIMMQQSMQFTPGTGAVKPTGEIGITPALVATFQFPPAMHVPIKYTFKAVGSPGEKPPHEPDDHVRDVMSPKARALLPSSLIWANSHTFKIMLGKFKGGFSKLLQHVRDCALPFAQFVDAIEHSGLLNVWPKARSEEEEEKHKKKLQEKLQKVAVAGYGAWSAFKEALTKSSASEEEQLSLKITFRQPEAIPEQSRLGPWKISAELKIITNGYPLDWGFLQGFLGDIVPLGSISAKNGTVLDLSGLHLLRCPKR